MKVKVEIDTDDVRNPVELLNAVSRSVSEMAGQMDGDPLVRKYYEADGLIGFFYWNGGKAGEIRVFPN